LLKGKSKFDSKVPNTLSLRANVSYFLAPCGEEIGDVCTQAKYSKPETRKLFPLGPTAYLVYAVSSVLGPKLVSGPGCCLCRVHGGRISVHGMHLIRRTTLLEGDQM